MADPIHRDGFEMMTQKFADLDRRIRALERPNLSQREGFLARIAELETQVASLRGANARVAAAFSTAATTDEAATPSEPDESATSDE